MIITKLQSTTLDTEIIKYVVFRMYNELLADMSKPHQLQSFSLYNYNNHHEFIQQVHIVI
jgi:hypothetical protein